MSCHVFGQSEFFTTSTEVGTSDVNRRVMAPNLSSYISSETYGGGRGDEHPVGENNRTVTKHCTTESLLPTGCKEQKQ